MCQEVSLPAAGLHQSPAESIQGWGSQGGPPLSQLVFFIAASDSYTGGPGPEPPHCQSHPNVTLSQDALPLLSPHGAGTHKDGEVLGSTGDGAVGGQGLGHML